jgi:hypothetical protein
MKLKKKKTKKLKSLSSKRKNKIDLRADAQRILDLEEHAGKGTEFFNKPVRVNVFEEAEKVNSYQQLENFVEHYMPGLSPAESAKILAKFVKDNWIVFKILKDPDHTGAVMLLLDWIDTKKGGAVAAYNHRVLKRFMMHTGYKKPATAKTFQNDITLMKTYFGMTRKKAKSTYSNLGDKEFSIFNKPKK